MKRLMVLLLVLAVLAACAPATPEVVEKEVVIEKPVVETVIVEKPVVETVIVEKEKVVEKEVVVTPAPKAGGTVTFALTNDPETLDPNVSQWIQMYEVMLNVCDTLLVQKPDGTYAPGLATSWEVSDDGKTWTLHLREDVKFHDGTPFNAAAVKFMFDRIIDPETKSILAAMVIGPYESSEVVDDYTVKITYKEPAAAFLSNISQVWFAPVSPTAVEKWGTEFGSHVVCTGPFKLVEWVPQDHITLEKNPDYNWAPEVYHHQGPPYLDQIIFKIVPEDVTRVGALESGELDVIEYPPPLEIGRLASNPRFEVEGNPFPGQGRCVPLNMQKMPTDDIEVRKAIFHAIDKAEINKAIYQNLHRLAYSILRSPTFGYDKSLETDFPYPYDPEKAKELLDAAGWMPGPDGIRVKDGQRLELVYHTFGPMQDTTDVATVIQAQLREVGMDVDVRPLTPGDYVDANSKGLMNMIMTWTNIVDPGLALEINFHSKNVGAFNFSRMADERMDKLLDDAAQELDPARRADLYHQIQQLIIRDTASAVPLFDELVFYARTARVQGWNTDTLAYPYLYDVFLEE